MVSGIALVWAQGMAGPQLAERANAMYRLAAQQVRHQP